MATNQTVHVLASIAGAALAGGVAYALARAPLLEPLRERVRDVFRTLKAHLVGEPVEGARDDADVGREEVRVEHGLERGAFGRARSAELGRKPHVMAAVTDASLRPYRARRHD